MDAILSGLEYDFEHPVEMPSWRPPPVNKRACRSCGKTPTTRVPLPQYGLEERVDVCHDCSIAQGLLEHVEFQRQSLRAQHQEHQTLEQAYTLCRQSIEDTQSSNSSGGSSGSESWSHVSPPETNPDPLSLSWQTVDTTAWIQVPPTEEATKALWDLIHDDPRFLGLLRLSPTLQRLANEVTQGRWSVADFFEHLAEAASQADSMTTRLKKQAFAVAADTGTAVKFLYEYRNQPRLLACVLDFLLKLCQRGELASVAFFWPQICHIHLLAYDNELIQDFLLTVAHRYSVQLALELVWSHTADLEESLSQTAMTSVHCKKRCFSILRFVCELESLLFDYDGVWGGGSVSLRNKLQATGQQLEYLKKSMNEVHELRLQSPLQLSRSAMRDRFERGSLPPEVAAQEKLRIARNAEYFSGHLNFTKRLSDIAEKLRFMEVEQRASTLEEELTLLNASGAMGGDPLNQLADKLARVVRVPPNEGHVFRSKERTPVLLLLEVVAEVADVESPSHSKEGDLVHTDSDPSAIEQHESVNEDHHDDAGHAVPLTPVRPDSEFLEGAIDETRPSPKTSALKRFDQSVTEVPEPPLTPRLDVEQIFQHVQDAELAVPSLDAEIGAVAIDEDVEDAVSGCACEEQAEPPIPNVDHQTAVDKLDEPVEENLSSPQKTTPSKRMSSLGSLVNPSMDGSERTKDLAPTGDIRREVLNAIMLRGQQGNSIAAGASDSVQRSLKELEQKRATELLTKDETPGLSIDTGASPASDAPGVGPDIASLRLDGAPSRDGEGACAVNEEDEVLEAIRLLLIQHRVAQGLLSPADAAKVLQHNSLSPINASEIAASSPKSDKTCESDMAMIDAGDVDARLAGCGSLPPAVLQALTLWKAGMVTNAELFDLVKKDIEFVRHSVLLDVENVEKLNENSAFWGRFSFGERWYEKKSRIAASSPMGSLVGWDLLGVIVKSNDDLRQEAFVMQLIELCEEAFQISGIELWVHPYRILATGRTTGVIEMVRNAMSFDALKKRPGYGKGGLREHLQRMTEYTADPGGSFKLARRNFVRSLASYSLLSYFFLFKDRHNGNILLDTAGHIIHIDFGFVFGVAPGGSFSLEMSTPFKLTEEMIDVMGGLKSPLFSEFVTLFCCGFLALQSHCDTFLTIVDIMSRESTFKCFEGQESAEIISKLRERFCPDLTKEQTVAHALDLIKQATTSYGTRQYDLFQYMSQGIAT